MRGYLFTALTVLMLASLFVFSYYFYTTDYASTAADIRAEKTANVFDDVACDVEEILGLDAAVRAGSDTVYGFNDRFPAAGIPSTIRNYTDYVEGAYATETAAELSLNAGALSSATASVDFTLHPFKYAYGYGNLSKKTVWFRNLTLEYEPLELNLTLDFRGENAKDMIWTEAEDYSLTGETVVDDSDASEDSYVRDFASMNTFIDVPLNVNYTLWVRTVYDNSSKNFTVEIDGRNSSRFDLRDEGASSASFKWFNDTDEFNLTAGVKTVKVHSLGAGTESIDVIMLTTDYLDLADAHNTRPRDPFTFYNISGGDMEVNVKVLFDNANHTHTSDLSRTAESQWNITFRDGDGVNVRLGGADGHYSSFTAALNDTVNSSNGNLNSSAVFSDTGDERYVDSGCTLNQAGGLARTGRLWLAAG